MPRPIRPIAVVSERIVWKGEGEADAAPQRAAIFIRHNAIEVNRYPPAGGWTNGGTLAMSGVRQGKSNEGKNARKGRADQLAGVRGG
jgi:hypothetical protein